MERTMSVEEKIRRAEEIYQRRRQENSKQIATVNVAKKKDLRLLKKMIIQIIVCILIYLIINTIYNNKYVFSEDFTNKVKEVLSYDTNFIEIYENLKNYITNAIRPKEDAMGGSNTQEQQIEENTVQEEQESARTNTRTRATKCSEKQNN